MDTPQKTTLPVIIALIGIALLIVIPLIGKSENSNKVHSFNNIEYTTNIENVSEVSDTVYFTIPVNTDVEILTFETDNAIINEEFHNSLKSIDTFIPGEYEVKVPEGEQPIRIIVDGLKE